jgi:hypothetical protein
MRVRLAPSRPLALGFVLALGALLLLALVSDSARAPLRSPLVPRAAREAAAAVPLAGREARRGTTVHRLELASPDAAVLLGHEELQLYLHGGPELSLVAGRLELRGTGCALVADARDTLTAREPVTFRRPNACARLAATAGPVALDLVVEARGKGEVRLLAFEVPGDAEAMPIAIVPRAPSMRPLVPRGGFVDYPPTAPRLRLLGQMWRSPGTGWLLSSVLLAVILAVSGCLVIPTRALPAGPARRGPLVLRAALGVALFAASLGLLYAVLAPPLSGPDEPYHLLGFAALTDDEALAADAVRFMGETHLWRIRQQPGERFRTIDVGRPYVVEDDQLRPTEVVQRSAIAASLFRLARPLAHGRPAPRALLALRLVNMGVFALAVGLAAALALRLADEPWPQWLAYPFLLVPALPFFATHVSETAVLSAVYVLLATSVALLFLDAPRSHRVGLPLGLASGLMLAGGRSPWPLAALVAAVLVGRALLASRSSSSPARDALVFWAGLGAGASVFYAVIDEPYRLMTETYAGHFVPFLPDALRVATVRLLTQPLAVGALAVFGYSAERALTPVRARLAGPLGSAARRLVPRATTALSAGVAASLLGSLLLRYPQLPTETTYALPLGERVAAVLTTMATLFRLDQPSFLLASSFWVGFGWLDTIPGPVLQGLLVALTGLALVWLLRDVGRRADGRRFAWLMVIAAGAVLALVFYAAATQGRVSTLVGRHLIGWYLCLLAVIGTALTLEPRTGGEGGATSAGAPRGGGRAAALLVVAGGVHVYCLWFVLQRYF